LRLLSGFVLVFTPLLVIVPVVVVVLVIIPVIFSFCVAVYIEIDLHLVCVLHQLVLFIVRAGIGP
jgi:uncharacterized membrane protein YqiK